MIFRTDVPTVEILAQMLESNSLHYLLHSLATLEKHPCPDEWADACSKLFIREHQPEELWVD